jgi:hypothetical protein
METYTHDGTDYTRDQHDYDDEPESETHLVLYWVWGAPRFLPFDSWKSANSWAYAAGSPLPGEWLARVATVTIIDLSTGQATEPETIW